MVKVIKLIEDFGEDLASEKHWLAAEYNYLQEMRKELQEAGKHLDSEEALRLTGGAQREFRQIGRSQRRVTRFEKRRERHLGELMHLLPNYAQDFYNKVENEINVAESHLTRGSSLFIGDLREKVENLKLDISVLRKLMKDKIPDLHRIQNYKGIITKGLISLDQHLAEMIKWVGALSVDIEREEAEERKLRKMAA